MDLCRTLRVARIEAFETFDWLFPAVVNTLEEVSQGIRNGWNKDQLCKQRDCWITLQNLNS